MSQQEMAVARTCYERGQKPSEIAATLGRDKIEYTLLQFSCVFPVAYSSAQFPAVAFQLQIPVANSISIGGSIRRRKN